MKNQVLDAVGVDRVLTRIAHEIVERNKGAERLVLIGISYGGDILAALLREKIAGIGGRMVPLGTVDVAMHRDDIGSRRQTVVGKTSVNFSVDDCQVILVDDVLFTGRTIRAAIDEIFELGRPRTIQVAVLVDRGHRELPIRPDFVGRNVPTSRQEHIQVTFGHGNFVEGVALATSAQGPAVQP